MCLDNFLFLSDFLISFLLFFVIRFSERSSRALKLLVHISDCP